MERLTRPRVSAILAAGGAGILAGRMAAGSKAWERAVED